MVPLLQIHDGSLPYFLIAPEDRDLIVRLFARAGVGLILTPEQEAIRVELPGHDRRSAAALLRRLLADAAPESLHKAMASVLEIRCAAAGTLQPCIVANRAKALGLLAG